MLLAFDIRSHVPEVGLKHDRRIDPQRWSAATGWQADVAAVKLNV